MLAVESIRGWKDRIIGFINKIEGVRDACRHIIRTNAM